MPRKFSDVRINIVETARKILPGFHDAAEMKFFKDSRRIFQ
jgi:hypothetical protein